MLCLSKLLTVYVKVDIHVFTVKKNHFLSCREMSDTLPRTARLQLEPLLVDYAELLSLMSASLSLRDDGVLDDVLAIYTKIGHDLAMQIPPSKFVRRSGGSS